MLSTTGPSTRLSLYASVLVCLAFVAWQTRAEQWFAVAMVVAPTLLSGYALLFARSKSHLVTLLCLAVISVRIIDSLQFHYARAESKIVHAEETDHLCKRNSHYALTEAEKGIENACAKAISTMAMSRAQVALSSIGGLNAWIWLFTGLDFKTGFHTLAESHIGYLWAAGTCFAVVTLFSSLAFAVFSRFSSAPGAVACVPQHNSSLYTPPQITYPKEDIFAFGKADLPLAFKNKKE